MSYGSKHFQADYAYSFLFLIGDKILFHMTEVGRKPPVFAEASFVAQEILDSGYEFEVGEMHYNFFK